MAKEIGVNASTASLKHLLDREYHPVPNSYSFDEAGYSFCQTGIPPYPFQQLRSKTRLVCETLAAYVSSLWEVQNAM
jgi:hypothetical protein